MNSPTTDETMRLAVEAAVTAVIREKYSVEPDDVPDIRDRLRDSMPIAIRAALPVIAEEWLAIVKRYDDQDEIDNGFVGTGAAGYALEALRARLAEMLGEKA